MNDLIKLSTDFQLLVFGMGLTSMVWLVILKYEIHYCFLSYFQKISSWLGFKDFAFEICVMCITFWISFVIFFVTNEMEMPARLSSSVIRSLIVTPFIISLLKDQFIGSD